MREFPDMPLRDVVFQTLRKGIHQGLLNPGERLIEMQLSDRLGVSRTPIREAIRMLEQEGLVVMLQRRGAVVSQITPKNLNDVLEVRIGIEKYATGLACGRITQEALEELDEAEKRFTEAMEQNDITLLATRDEEFHNGIYKATSNDVILKLIANMREQMYRYRLEYLKDEKVRATLVKEHRSLLESLKQGDREAAEQTAVTHIERQREYILNVIRENE